jgi:protein-disulfide isomerase
MSKRFVLTLLAIMLLFGGTVVLARHKTAAPGSSGVNGGATNHTFGDGDKGVTLVEYGDLQCPACGQYFPLVKQLKEQYQKPVKFQFRHFPLVQIHKHAMEAARAAEAAGLQGKFWEMHDMLYTQQNTWVNLPDVTKVFEDYASNLGLNTTKFKQDIASTQVSNAIDADIKAGQALNVESTPTFLLDGKKIDNPKDLAGFSKLLDDAIASKK